MHHGSAAEYAGATVETPRRGSHRRMCTTTRGKGPIPMGGDELQLVERDPEAGGYRVAGVARLKN